MAFFCDRCPNCHALIEVRSEGQNGAFHAICNELSKQVDWPRGSGTMIGVLPWKRLLIAAWERAHGRPAGLYQSIDGAGFDVVYQRSSRMAKKEMAELIEFANAFAAENDVRLREEAF